MRRIYRFILLFGHFLYGLYLFKIFLKAESAAGSKAYSPKMRKHTVRWVKRFLHILNIRVKVHGDSFQHPAIIVSNHISWIDILVFISFIPSRFIAKQEIASWGISGAVIADQGTLFIKRGSVTEVKKLAEAMKKLLQIGESVLFFPEGKTSDGQQILSIYPGLLQTAIDDCVDLQPILLTYADSHYPSKSVPYLDDQSLMSCLWAMLQEKQIQANLFLLPTISYQLGDRKQLAAIVQESLSTQLQKELGKG